MDSSEGTNTFYHKPKPYRILVPTGSSELDAELPTLAGYRQSDLIWKPLIVAFDIAWLNQKSNQPYFNIRNINDNTGQGHHLIVKTIVEL